MTDKVQDDADVKARNEAVARERMYQEQRIKDRYINSLIREARQQGMLHVQEDARKPFLTVFLDGRNEHGSHVLPMPGDSIGSVQHCLDIQSLLEDQSEGLAEKIISEAKVLGFEIGHCVVTIWRHTNDSDWPGNDYFEYVCVSESLTVLFCGSATEQREMFERAAGEGK